MSDHRPSSGPICLLALSGELSNGELQGKCNSHLIPDSVSGCRYQVPNKHGRYHSSQWTWKKCTQTNFEAARGEKNLHWLLYLTYLRTNMDLPPLLVTADPFRFWIILSSPSIPPSREEAKARPSKDQGHPIRRQNVGAPTDIRPLRTLHQDACDASPRLGVTHQNNFQPRAPLLILSVPPFSSRSRPPQQLLSHSPR